jgi:hypothetical protein
MGRILNLILLLVVVAVFVRVLLASYTPEVREEFNKSLTTTTTSLALTIPHYALEEPIVEWKLPSDKYVFIECMTEDHLELIEGNSTDYGHNLPRSTNIGYDFNKTNGILISTGHIPINDTFTIFYGHMPVNDTLKVVFGGGEIKSGAVGYIIRTNLLFVYNISLYNYIFPHNSMIFTPRIIKVDLNGTVYLKYKNISIILKDGEEWVKVTSKITPTFDLIELKGRVQVGKLNLTTTDRIINYGIQDKSKIFNQTIE